MHIQDLTPKNGGDFDSKLRAWDTSLHTLHTTQKDNFNLKRLGRVPGEKAWQRYFVTESSRRSVIRNVGRSPGCLACSKRSDSGERCGVKKAMKSRGGPLLLPRFYFFALLFTSHRSPLSERLEQATGCSLLAEVFKPPNNRGQRPLLVGKTH